MTAPAPLAFFTGAPGPGELVVLFLVVLVLFGPKRLPHIARSIGKVLNDLRRASQDFRDQVMQIDQEPPVDVPHHEHDTEEEPPVDVPHREYDIEGEADDAVAEQESERGS
jgi:TatA/E family protein of Tat protein translocase